MGAGLGKRFCWFGVVNRRLFAKSVRRVYTTTPIVLGVCVCVCVGSVPKYIFTLWERTRPNDDFVVVLSHQERAHPRRRKLFYYYYFFLSNYVNGRKKTSKKRGGGGK